MVRRTRKQPSFLLWIVRFLKKYRYLFFGAVFLLAMWGMVLWGRFFRSQAVLVPAAGGQYTEVVVGKLQNLSPLAPNATPVDEMMHSLLYRGLLAYNPANGQVEDGLANFRVSEDGLEYLLTMKSTARFSNGDDVTLNDVLFTYEQVILNPDFTNGALRSQLEYVTIEVRDETTIAFTLPEPYFYFPMVLTAPVLHAASFDGAFAQEVTDPNFKANRRPVGAGPFALTTIVPKDDGTLRIFLEKNPYFYGNEPYLDKAIFTVHPSFAHFAATPEFVTAFSFLPQREIEAFLKTLHDSYAPRAYVLPRWAGLFFQLDKPLMARNSLREALSLAVPKRDILEEGWRSVDTPFFFDGVQEAHVYDPAQGRAALNRGGITLNAETNQREINGEKVVLNVVTSTEPPVYSRMAQQIVSEWEKQLQLDVTFRALPPAEFTEVLTARDYDVVLFGQNYGQNVDTFGTWHSSRSGGLNLSNLTNEGIDAVIYEIQQTGDQQELFDLAARLNKLLPAVPLATPSYAYLVSPELKGTATLLKPRRHADRLYGIEQWYVQEKKDWPEDLEDGRVAAFIEWLQSDERAFNPEAIPAVMEISEDE